MQSQRRRPSFQEQWEQQRKGGLLYAIFLIGGCTMILLLFLQLIWQTARQDFSGFPFHPVFLLIAAGAGAAYWYINEARYKKLLARKKDAGPSR